MNRAFELAYLIIGDRMTAIRIVVAAMDSLKVASSIQVKRHAYVPMGRAASRAARNKVSLSTIHMLQRLVYVESEIYERLLEQVEGALTQEDMVIHYLKHMVRIATKRNSFYVSLGLARLLYNYTTPEAAEIYNLVLQDPDRIRDDYYYRSRKARLLHELKERFGNLVQTYRSNQQEERFQTHEDSGSYVGLVKECLMRFTPWGTTCVLPASFDPAKNILLPFLFKGDNPDEEHTVEINRIHTLLHPPCFKRLVLALGLDPPNRRLGVPYFFISGGDRGTTDDRFNPPGLTEQELNAIKSSLNRKGARRRRKSGQSLRVYVDGVERARLELAQASRIRLEVGDDAEVIYVWAADAQEDILLASHFLARDESGILPSQSVTLAEGGQQICFFISAHHTPTAESPSALIHIEYRETKWHRAAALYLLQLKHRLSENGALQELKQRGWLKPVLLLLALLICIAGLLIYFQSRRQGTAQPSVAGQKESQPSIPPPANQNSNEAPPPSVRPTPHDRREHEPPPDQLAVNPPTGNRVTRAARMKRLAVRLLSVQKVYVDPLGEDALSQQVREVLIERLRSSNRFTVVSNRDEADAVFKGGAARVEQNAEMASVVLKLVNIDGQVIWPLTTGKSARRYTGRVANLGDRLLHDLLNDIQRLERMR